MPTKRRNLTAHFTEDHPLCKSPMMAHLWKALQQGTDVGHYGRFVFAVVARHFLPEDQLLRLFSQQPGQDAAAARALLLQVQERQYNPPSRETILQWQAEQDFPLCPNPDDPTGCNLYRELEFPDGIYDHIEDYWEQRVQSEKNKHGG